MKILINTLEPTQVNEINETRIAEYQVALSDFKTGKVIGGLKPIEPVEPVPFDSNVVIGGETFPPGEWLHKDDKWVEENADELANYPYIKEAGVVLQEKVAKVLLENNLNAFAQGIKEGRETYGDKVDEVVLDVHKYAPYVVPEEVKVEAEITPITEEVIK